MTAYEAGEWTDFFVATAGASAALAGLVFVAVSINVEPILRFEGLPERALATVLLLLSLVLVSFLGLIPGQSNGALGVELLVTGVGFGVFVFVLMWRSVTGSARDRRKGIDRQVMVAMGTVPVVIGAVSLLAEAGGGLYWVAGGMVAATIAAVANAWVLLVEILR